MNPATCGLARSLGTVCALVSPECGFPTATSQFQPATTGSETTCARLDPNTSAAITAASATTMPRMAERTGTADRSRPGSKASRTPDTAVGGNPRRASQRAAREPRPPGDTGRPAWTCAARSADSAARPASSRASTAAPPSRISGSKEKPGVISAWRASPIGVNTESP